MKTYEVLNNYDEAAKMSNFRALIVKDPMTETDEEAYGIIFETWNPDARDWKTVDVQFGFYSLDEVKDYFKTEVKHPIDCICAESSELGDVKLWVPKYKMIEVADGLV